MAWSAYSGPKGDSGQSVNEKSHFPETKTMKNLISKIALCGLLLAASMSFAQTIVQFTTLAAAITSSSSQANTFQLTSTTGITAGNTMLFLDGEADFVNAVNGNFVTVTRGAGPASRVSTHPTASKVWYGPPSYFQSATPVEMALWKLWSAPHDDGAVASLAMLPYIDITNKRLLRLSRRSLGCGALLASLPRLVTFAPDPGGAVLTGVGTSTATTNTSMYCSANLLARQQNVDRPGDSER